MLKLCLSALVMALAAISAEAATNTSARAQTGIASWYGEAHRGKPMANGKAFNPDKLTAASWFYPLGTTLDVQVTGKTCRSVTVVVSDRGPSKELVKQGRVIDLSREAFNTLAKLEEGLVRVQIRPAAIPPQAP